MTRPLRVILIGPGASWSTADVEAGLRYGLQHHGVHVVPYRLDQRIEMAHKWLHVMWRKKSKADPALPKPHRGDVIYQAGVGALEMALRHQVDVVLAVSSMFLHPDVVVMMKRAGLRVTVLFTESPYDHEREIEMAKRVDGCWTNERSVLADFQAVNPNSGYLPHGWHPERHRLDAPMDTDVPSHDVVFVGSAFPERVKWFNAIDWSGIDLGLYGLWSGCGLKKQVKACVKADTIGNELASMLYRRAKVGLNLYRVSKGFGTYTPMSHRAESLSPRAYELAACGAFHISEHRDEVRETFGDLVPTFQTPIEAAALLRLWLADESGRAAAAAQLPARVAEASWINRAKTVIGDLQKLTTERAA
jgi:hypothetical protein